MQPVSLQSNYCGWSPEESALSLLTDMLKNISGHSLTCLWSCCSAVAHPYPAWMWLWPAGVLPNTAASGAETVIVYCGSACYDLMCFHAKKTHQVKISFPCGEGLGSRMSTDPKIQQYLKRKTLSWAWSQIKPFRKRHKSATRGVSHWHKTFPGCSHDPSLTPGLSYAGINQEWHGLTSVFWQRCSQEQGHLFPWLLNNWLQDLVTWVIAGDKMELPHWQTPLCSSYCGRQFVELCIETVQLLNLF